MALLPYVFGYDHNWPIVRPERLRDQPLGLVTTPEDLLTSLAGPLLSSDNKPWRQLAATAKDVGSTIKSDKDKFQVNIDVQHFAPDEIKVTTADGHIIVEGKHEEKKDEHGYISRQFVRRYALPKGCTEGTVESRLSSDGVLTIVVPRKLPLAAKGERLVPITKTGPVRKEIKDQTVVMS